MKTVRRQPPKKLRRRLARLASSVVNPFSVSAVMVILVAFTAEPDPLKALNWVLVSLGVSIMPTVVVIVYLVRTKRIEGIFLRVRRERHRIYVLATVCVIANIVVLHLLGAPPVLTAAFCSAVAVMVLLMLINLKWKISVHMAFVAAAVTIMVILYGLPALFAAVLLPLIGWARIELEHHTPAQVVGGTLLGVLVIFAVYRVFGLAVL